MTATIDKYFRDLSDKIGFLELKNIKELYIDYGLNDIPLPIISEDLMLALQNNHLENEVDSKYIIDGMLFSLGVDPDFRYAKDYINVVKNILEAPSKYAVSRSIEAIDKDFERALVFSRAAKILDPKDKFASYTYARLLWRVEVDEKEKSDFIARSIEILEEILAIDPEFGLAYYELANIYAGLGRYMKAMSFYRNTLEKVDIETIKEEIRERMEAIEADALVEEAIQFINRMDYKKALGLLNEAQRNVTRYDVLYYMAVCYMNLEELSLADEYFDLAVKGGADFATLYIDYIFVKYSMGKPVEALALANEAIDKYPADLKIRYNRALIEVELDRIDKAIEDLDFILEYADLSDEFSSQVRMVRNSLSS